MRPKHIQSTIKVGFHIIIAIIVYLLILKFLHLAILDDEKNDPVDRINDEEFKEAERYLFKEYKEDDKLITHPQAIYTSRLLDPYTEGLAIDFTESNNEK
ncbi:kinase-like domain-containing protein [Rhizophagus irregularis DAOM 181602=DAOM 197198]|nr:kinase-like domain-containing protein [Rhizophagus irregularis DAOM 181602=DAOM 197198]